MKKYESQRGAILVESALVVGAIFLMLFGTVFLAIIGFDQMSSDGAAYEVAHQTSVGASAPPAQSAHNTFPNVPQANISAAIQPAPAASIAVDYGYNDPNSQTAQDSDNNRHGGVSMVQGTSVNGVANKNSASILGMPINVVGNMVEPMWLENGLHFDAQNSNNYGSTAATCASPPPVSGNATPQPTRCFQGNIFTQGENTPQYYTSVNVMVLCSRNLPWGTNLSYLNPPNPDVCTQSSEAYVPLGVAEFLDVTNWCASTTSPCTTAPSAPGISGSAQTDSTFANIACHQRVYTTIANFFQNNSTLDGIYKGNSLDNSDNLLNDYVSGQGGGPALYYAHVYLQPNGTGGASTFNVFAGYDTPATSQNYSNPSAAVSGKVDTAIREVYGWDGQDLQNPPVADPLLPNAGC